MFDSQSNCGVLKLGTPPRYPREWRVFARLPEGVPLDDHAAHDRAAAAAAPPGWYCVGTIPISPRDRTQLDNRDAWRLRVTYWPEAWRPLTSLLAPPAVYAAAQVAGLRTLLDATLCADYHGIQYLTPDGHPLMRECCRWQRALPARISAELSTMEEIDRCRSVGYMWGRPKTGRAMAIAIDEEVRGREARARAAESVCAWIRETHPGILG